ncbi:MAG: hypothetical protein F6K34_12070 [Okeania sp. SIO4D6]|uniref:hypothetical protein n=1 Tax=Okeania sp. SIO2F5 TaxID=2607794 RepID=UPI0013B94CF6|nr:hypothetical protein [Okeania sp. SIO2F5]NEP05490.1 hypothetical protein [Okeania sp. SIO4D6]NEP94465.1 hypothetical protein [Okeania sp. SIO2F5]
MRFTSLLVGVGDSYTGDSYTGDNPPLTPPRRGEMDRERGGRSKNCQFGIFLPNL